jgi:addiction module RelE/StbE family toxin
MKLEWSEAARQDMNALFAYLDARNPQAADKTEAAIFATAEELLVFPKVGRLGRVQGTRELVVTGTPYLLIYATNAETVFIVRVLHGAQKFP